MAVRVFTAIPLGTLVVFLGGCSLFYKSTRPVPGASENLRCFVEYRPSPVESSKPDLLFMAMAYPYRLEQVYMNPVDMFVHGVFAPGRHLRKPIRVLGASCEQTRWNEGYRVPALVRPRKGLSCKRNGLERVVIEGETKYGRCRIEIPAGDSAPICKQWSDGDKTLRIGKEIQRILGEPCRARLRGPRHDDGAGIGLSSAREVRDS